MTNEEEESFTFMEDLGEIKTLIGDVMMQINKLQQSNEEIKDRARSIGGGEPPEKIKEMQELIKRYES